MKLIDPRQNNGHKISGEERLAAWTRYVVEANAAINPLVVRSVADSIARQSFLLGAGGGMQPEKIMEYLLSRALEWIVRDRIPVDKILAKMPKNTRDLGIMVLVEGVNPDNGRKLNPEEFTGKKIIT